MPRRSLRLRVIAALLTGTSSCGSDDQGSTEAVFEIAACRGAPQAPAGETFRVLVRDPAVIQALASLVGQGNQRIVLGTLRAGTGGVNAPWSWHLEPSSVAVVQNTIELCDGCPSQVEADLASWLNVGQFCPWTSEVTARVR